MSAADPCAVFGHIPHQVGLDVWECEVCHTPIAVRAAERTLIGGRYPKCNPSGHHMLGCQANWTDWDGDERGPCDCPRHTRIAIALAVRRAKRRWRKASLADMFEPEFARGCPPASALAQGVVTLREALYGIDA